jgi:hypothetical protein
MHTKKGPPEQSITLRENREVIRDKKQVAETLNDYFTNITRDLVVEKHSALKDQSHTSRVPRINRESNDNLFTFGFTNKHVVRDVLDNIKVNKAQGYDLIPPKALKSSSQTIAKPLSDLINVVISKSVVPDTWKC